MQVHTHKSGKLDGNEEEETLRVLTERAREEIPIERGVRSLEGREESWTTMSIMGKFMARIRGRRREE